MTDAFVADRSLIDAQTLARVGRLDEAARLFREHVRFNPRHLTALHWLGLIYFQSGQFDRAQEIMSKALRIEPRFFEAYRIRGLSLMLLKKYPAAPGTFERALALQPNHVELLVNSGLALLELQRPSEALKKFDRALELNPNNAACWNNRANAFVAMERYEEAVVSYDRALALDPTLETARRNRFVVMHKLKRLTRIADFALREMFDAVAPEFDSMMVDGLSYRGHLNVREMAGRVIDTHKAGWRILDIGCGPGLVGEAFTDMAAGGRLDGLDLAPRMIETARKRGIYDELILGDLESVLNEEGRQYDLIVSADTMIYLGDLALAFSGAANRLVEGGYYIFACESKAGQGWELNEADRFSHSEAYLREEAARAGLAFVDLIARDLRFEKGKPVGGLAVALRKP